MQVNTSYREIFRMALPVMVGSFAMTVVNVTDTVFLGRIGETELGASAVGGVLYFVFAMIGISIGIGTQIIISRRAGEKNHPAIGEVFDQSLIILSVLAVLLFVFLKWVAPPLLPFILNGHQLIDATSDFLSYRSYGILFVLLATAYRSLYVGIARPRVYGYYSFLMAFVNILCGYAFIFGHWGSPEMGIKGAGLASSLAELISLIYLVLFTVFKKEIKQFQLFRFKSFSRADISKIFTLSLPLIVQNILSMGAWFVFFVFIEKIGAHELALSNVVRGSYMISMTPFWGFSVSANSMVSNIIGQGRKDEVMVLLNRILNLTMLVAVVMILINLLFPEQILGIFTNDPQLIHDSLKTLQVVDIALIFFSFAIVCINAVSGTGATRMALYIEVVSIFLYLAYIYLFTFVYKGSVESVWFSEVIYWSFAGAACYWYLRSGVWKRLKTL